MAEKLHWFPFYYRDFFSDERVLCMSNTQVGMYLKLLAHQWHEGSIPNDIEALGRLVHTRNTRVLHSNDDLRTPADVARIETDQIIALIKQCFVKNGRPGRLVNPRLEQVRVQQLSEKQKKSDHGKKAIEARWKREREKLSGNTPVKTGITREYHSESESESSDSQKNPQIPSSVSQKKPTRGATPKKRSVLPEDFKPNPKHEDIAKGLGLSLAAEVTKFKDHHQAKGSLMLDWDAALRKWLRNAVEFRRPR